jgi:hypothetical protein
MDECAQARRRPKRLLATAGIAALLLAMTIRLPQAPATVAEQRARLPPAAECESDVEGRWRGLVYNQREREWYDRILDIRHVEGSDTELTGMIFAESWEGGPELSEPSPCAEARFRGKMVGRGSYVDGAVTFAGGEFQLTEVACGRPVPYRHYYPDRFTGRINKTLQEFQSVNNDGGVAINEPNLFRRIACFDDEARPDPNVESPPPFFPPRGSGGCSAAR